MVYEKSCGAIVVRTEPQENRIYILMIRHRPGGYRSFPKGHVEPGETERQTAVREVREETAAEISIIPDFRHAVCYAPAPSVEKEVVYFLGRVEDRNIRPRKGEIAQVEWIPLDTAEKYLTHENDKKVMRAARCKIKDLQQKGEWL
jgi:8-oxo-dGTP pyrophosphatase MutT (NUDIX family)